MGWVRAFSTRGEGVADEDSMGYGGGLEGFVKDWRVGRQIPWKEFAIFFEEDCPEFLKTRGSRADHAGMRTNPAPDLIRGRAVRVLLVEDPGQARDGLS